MKGTRKAQASLRSADGERRGDKRYSLAQSGTLWYGGEPFACSVINISAGGALLEVGVAPAVGQNVLLHVPDWGRFGAEVVHGIQDILGLAFPIHETGERGALRPGTRKGRPTIR